MPNRPDKPATEEYAEGQRQPTQHLHHAKVMINFGLERGLPSSRQRGDDLGCSWRPRYILDYNARHAQQLGQHIGVSRRNCEIQPPAAPARG